MKKLYNRYISFLESLPGLHQYYKMYIAEHIALWRKRKLINSVHWSKEQNEEFDKFWNKNYKKIKKSGNQLFEAFNGVFNPQYIPDFLYATKIESKFNSYQHAKIYSDKSLTEIFYKGKSEALLPKTILLKAGGVFYDENRNVIGSEKAREILSNVKDCVIKPTVGGNSGKGVIIGSFDKSGWDEKNKYRIFSLLDKSEDNYIVQEKIRQSDSLNQLYPHSINTFRVITYISDSKVNVAPVSLRLGAGGNQVDNIHAGGLGVGVDSKNNYLLKHAYKLGYSNKKIILTEHPDTHIKFEDYKIEGINSMMKSAIKLHNQTPHIGIISWDFTLNIDNIPILIEANYIGQAVWLSQIVTGEPFFGQNILSILKSIQS